MDIPEDPRERKNWMMEILQDYGREFLIFEPEDQPNVFAAPEPEYRSLRSDNLDPRELRSWRYLDFTLQFLRERYGLFTDQHLVSDCPVHQLHPLRGESAKDFRRSFQLTAEGTIKFRCRRSIGCRRRHCSAKNNRSMDLYDLVALLDKKGREHARQVVADYYEKLHGQKLGHFPRSEEPGTGQKTESSVMRYAVPKAALQKLFSIPIKGRGAGGRFANLALKLITGSPLVPVRRLQLRYGRFHSLEQHFRLDCEARRIRNRIAAFHLGALASSGDGFQAQVNRSGRGRRLGS